MIHLHALRGLTRLCGPALLLAARAVAAQSPATTPPASPFGHVAPNGVHGVMTGTEASGTTGDCSVSGLLTGGGAVGHQPGNGSPLESMLGGTVAAPLCARHPLVFSVHAGARTGRGAIDNGSYRAGASLALPLRTTTVALSYRASSMARESSLPVSPDSGHSLQNSAGLARDVFQEYSLAIARAVGDVSFGFAAGAVRGNLRGNVTSPAQIVRDSVWTDTLGWVPSSREVGEETIERVVPARWMSGELYATWTRPRFGVAANIGGRLLAANVSDGTWGAIELSTRLRPAIWLVAATGIRPYAPRLSGADSRYSTIGIRFAIGGRVPDVATPTPVEPHRSFVVDRIDAGVYRVSVHAPGATVVELAGDFTNWLPLQLHRTASGQAWFADLRVAPGAYRANVRIDGGAWAAPTGAATVADDFGGTAGLVILPER